MDNNLSPQFKNLLIHLHAYHRARVIITIKAGVPVLLKRYEFEEMEGAPEVIPLTDKEVELQNNLRAIWYGQLELFIIDGQVDSVLEGTHKIITL